ncbi:hypothetical protein MKZ38_002120 [Zalerion maritima]|uniref:Uncharacterized protein n=1 Tax=Zalerion maritima TaxID=339359 RepID=A0AAD5RQ31_9PEZI|nr:hypothetical protein MKZ38_002120 [Zalerion maritima]
MAAARAGWSRWLVKRRFRNGTPSPASPATLLIRQPGFIHHDGHDLGKEKSHLPIQAAGKVVTREAVKLSLHPVCKTQAVLTLRDGCMALDASTFQWSYYNSRRGKACRDLQDFAGKTNEFKRKTDKGRIQTGRQASERFGRWKLHMLPNVSPCDG